MGAMATTGTTAKSELPVAVLLGPPSPCPTIPVRTLTGGLIHLGPKAISVPIGPARYVHTDHYDTETS